jgi:hypothetical protein
MWKKIFCILLCTLLIQGCSAIKEMENFEASIYQNRCTNYGYKQGTSEHTACVQKEADKARGSTGKGGECNAFGCSKSSVANCNAFGCPNPPMGSECNAYGCPESPPLPQTSSGSSTVIVIK